MALMELGVVSGVHMAYALEPLHAHRWYMRRHMYSLMKVHTPDQVYLQCISSKVWFCPKCLDRG